MANDKLPIDSSPVAETPALVVSQTGDGDYRSIAKAIEAAPEGATIRIGSGFYEEALVVSKPLTLTGDARGLAVLANSNFAVLTVRSGTVRLRNLALVAGLRQPSVEVHGGEVEFENSILWALDSFLKQTNPNLNPARALVGDSFLGACMKGFLPIAEVVSDLLRPALESLVEAADAGRNSPPQTGADVLLNSGARFIGAYSFIGMASIVGTARSMLSFADCRLDYTAVTSCEDTVVRFSGCDRFGEPGKPRVHVREGPCNGLPVQKHPAPDPVKREMEATLRRRMLELKARVNGHPPTPPPTAQPEPSLI